jgi:leucyl aminopeptidase
VNVEATTDSPLTTDADTIAVGVFEDEGVAHDLPDGALGALLASGEAQRSFKHLAVTHSQGRRFILAGLGPRDQFDPERARVAAAVVHGRAREGRTTKLCWEVPHHVDDAVVGGLVEGTLLRAYRFDRYKRAPQPPPHDLETLLVSAHHDISAPVAVASVITAAQNRARALADTPANDLTPSALGDYAERVEGVRVTVFDGEQIRAAGMGAFAAVAQGSDQDPRLIQLEYDGPESEAAPRVALIGKAVTFDSGGLSIKPAGSMQDMKFDMAGGAAVIEAIAALAELRAPVRVLGVIGATENLINGSSVKPGDIVRALDGTTIEINNTDAEGRLVLADCITHARRAGADRLIDAATLTGGIIVALGSVYAGLMCNDDALAASLQAAGERTGELVWRMPLHPDYANLMKGRYADLSNVTARREASAIAGAEFIHHFAGDTPWAHLDIAGTGFNASRPYIEGKSATGWGVRLLVDLVRHTAA